MSFRSHPDPSELSRERRSSSISAISLGETCLLPSPSEEPLLPVSYADQPQNLHRKETFKSFAHQSGRDFIRSIPAVFLGVLLNVLDAVSYGLLIFPVHSLPDFFPSYYAWNGISIFMISTVISQLVYALGGSSFRGGNGSMMIEVIPFFHSICRTVVSRVTVPTDGDGSSLNSATSHVGSTVMFIYALSTVLTGIIFAVLGIFRLGSVVNFFPKPFLIGIIGGIGIFLVRTALEIATDEVWSWSVDFFQQLFKGYALAIWLTSLGLAVMLKLVQSKIWQNVALLVPAFYCILFGLFFAVLAIFRIPVDVARENGWLLSIEIAEDGKFYDFWREFDITRVDWGALVQTAPAVLALIVFGILHVPINLPALAISTGKEDFNINRELIGHGVSNIVSGLFLTVQNYMVYCNSVLFMRAGGDSRIAGVLLGVATAVVSIFGIQLINFIPTIVICSLIMHLGIDLLKESVVDPWNQMSRVEYALIWIILIVMTIFEFTDGILVGIVLSGFIFIYNYACCPTVRDGSREDDDLIVLHLQGYLFFGNSNQLLSKVTDLMSTPKETSMIVLNFSLVSSVDHTWMGSLRRIHRLLASREINLVVCDLPPNILSMLEKNFSVFRQSHASTVTKRSSHLSDMSAESVDSSVISYFEHLDDLLQGWSTSTSPSFDRLTSGRE